MKKLIFVVLIIASVLCMFACQPSEEQTDSDIIYTISLSQEENKVNCTQSTTITNVYSEGLTSLTFNLYANAYSETAVNKAYSEALSSYGGIKITSVSIAGIVCVYSYSKDNSLLYVTIPELALDESVTVDMAYAVTLPQCDLRMGIDGNTTKLSNFYPQLAVYEDNAFREDAFSTIGDPFYSEVADYEVVITVPSETVVACSGSLISETPSDTNTVLKYSADKIRDFAIVMDNDLLCEKAVSGTTEVLYYYYEDEDPTATLKYATDALSVFGESFGAYPFETLSIVTTAFNDGGMEYGRLVYIADDVTDVEGTIVHEIAHQWWYGLVGNDSFNEAYLDEGLTCYSTLYYYKQIYGDAKYEEATKSLIDSYVLYERIQTMRKTGADLSINKSIYDFTSYQYEMLVYKKGAMMFAHIMNTMGEEKFNKALSAYVKDYSYKIATTDNLTAALTKSFGGDMAGIVNGWLGTQIRTTVFYS